MTSQISIGDTVKLKGDRIGLVRFKGKVSFGVGEWFGIQLYNSGSRHDGMIDGKRYFRTPRLKGLFVKKDQILCHVSPREAQKQMRAFQLAGTRQGHGMNLVRLRHKNKRRISNNNTHTMFKSSILNNNREINSSTKSLPPITNTLSSINPKTIRKLKIKRITNSNGVNSKKPDLKLQVSDPISKPKMKNTSNKLSKKNKTKSKLAKSESPAVVEVSMANTHPSFTNLEQTNGAPLRTSYGIDPIFSRLDRRLAKLTDMNLVKKEDENYKKNLKISMIGIKKDNKKRNKHNSINPIHAKKLKKLSFPDPDLVSPRKTKTFEHFRFNTKKYGGSLSRSKQNNKRTQKQLNTVSNSPIKNEHKSKLNGFNLPKIKTNAPTIVKALKITVTPTKSKTTQKVDTETPMSDAEPLFEDIENSEIGNSLLLDSKVNKKKYKKTRKVSMEFNQVGVELKPPITKKGHRIRKSILTVYSLYPTKADYPNLDDYKNSTLIANFLTEETYDKYRNSITLPYGNTLDDCIASSCFYIPDIIGFRLCDPQSYVLYNDLIDDLLLILHNEFNPKDPFIKHKSNTNWQQLLDKKTVKKMGMNSVLGKHGFTLRAGPPKLTSSTMNNRNSSFKHRKSRRHRKRLKKKSSNGSKLDDSNDGLIFLESPRGRRRSRTGGIHSEIAISPKQKSNKNSNNIKDKISNISVDIDDRIDPITKPRSHSCEASPIPTYKASSVPIDETEKENLLSPKENHVKSISDISKKSKTDDYLKEDIKQLKSTLKEMKNNNSSDDDSYGFGNGDNDISSPSSRIRRRKLKNRKDMQYRASSSLYVNHIELLDSNYVINCRIHVSRNIHGFPFMNKIRRAERRKLESMLRNIFNSSTKVLNGKYKSYVNIDKRKIETLLQNDKLFPKPNSPGLILAGYARDWPESRGVFVNHTKNIYIWVGYMEHIHILSIQSNSNIMRTFQRLFEANNQLQKEIKKYQEHFIDNMFKKNNITNIPLTLESKSDDTDFENDELPSMQTTMRRIRSDTSPDITSNLTRLKTRTFKPNTSNPNYNKKSKPTLRKSNSGSKNKRKSSSNRRNSMPKKRKNSKSKDSNDSDNENEFNMKKLKSSSMDKIDNDNTNRNNKKLHSPKKKRRKKSKKEKIKELRSKYPTGFVYDDKVGYLQSSPQFFGTAMRVFVTCKLPNLIQHKLFQEILEQENMTAYQQNYDFDKVNLTNNLFQEFKDINDKSNILGSPKTENNNSNSSNSSNTPKLQQSDTDNVNTPTTESPLLVIENGNIDSFTTYNISQNDSNTTKSKSNKKSKNKTLKRQNSNHSSINNNNSTNNNNSNNGINSKNKSNYSVKRSSSIQIAKKLTPKNSLNKSKNSTPSPKKIKAIIAKRPSLRKKRSSQSKSLSEVDTKAIIDELNKVNNNSNNNNNNNVNHPYKPTLPSIDDNDNEFDDNISVNEHIDEGKDELIGGKTTITLFQTVCLGITEVEQVKLMIKSINNLIDKEKLLENGEEINIDS